MKWQAKKKDNRREQIMQSQAPIVSVLRPKCKGLAADLLSANLSSTGFGRTRLLLHFSLEIAARSSPGPLGKTLSGAKSSVDFDESH